MLMAVRGGGGRAVAGTAGRVGVLDSVEEGEGTSTGGGEDTRGGHRQFNWSFREAQVDGGDWGAKEGERTRGIGEWHTW